ncbi:MAG TPA: hypothetical protein VD838_01035 [Anaeromyxobacteraceae bacterium]|nr:hypothetical protein [Anaeromyxobacteraceae bacterium]
MTRTDENGCRPLDFACIRRRHLGAVAVIALWVAIVAGFLAETAPGHQRWVSDPVTVTLGDRTL